MKVVNLERALEFSLVVLTEFLKVNRTQTHCKVAMPHKGHKTLMHVMEK